jgi:hypothetical protein
MLRHSSARKLGSEVSGEYSIKSVVVSVVKKSGFPLLLRRSLYTPPVNVLRGTGNIYEKQSLHEFVGDETEIAAVVSLRNDICCRLHELI